MPHKISILALRRWYCASVAFLLFTAVCVAMLYVDAPSDAVSQLAAWLAFVAAAMNAWNFRTNLRQRRAEEERE